MARHQIRAAKPKPAKPKAELRAAPSWYDRTHPVGSAERFLDQAAKEALAAAAAGGLAEPRQLAAGAVRAVAKKASEYPDPLLQRAAELPAAELAKRAARAEAYNQAMRAQNGVVQAMTASMSPVADLARSQASAALATRQDWGGGNNRVERVEFKNTTKREKERRKAIADAEREATRPRMSAVTPEMEAVRAETDELLRLSTGIGKNGWFAIPRKTWDKMDQLQKEQTVKLAQDARETGMSYAAVGSPKLEALAGLRNRVVGRSVADKFINVRGETLGTFLAAEREGVRYGPSIAVIPQTENLPIAAGFQRGANDSAGVRVIFPREIALPDNRKRQLLFNTDSATPNTRTLLADAKTQHEKIKNLHDAWWYYTRQQPEIIQAASHDIGSGFEPRYGGFDWEKTFEFHKPSRTAIHRYAEYDPDFFAPHVVQDTWHVPYTVTSRSLPGEFREFHLNWLPDHAAKDSRMAKNIPVSFTYGEAKPLRPVRSEEARAVLFSRDLLERYPQEAEEALGIVREKGIPHSFFRSPEEEALLYRESGLGYRQDAKGGDASRTLHAAQGSQQTEPPVDAEVPAEPSPGPRIVINPKVFEDRRDALCVAFNEAFRVVMEDNGFEPVSEPTEKQRKFFADTAYADDEVQLRRTILARIATLDTSVSDPTDEQLEETAEMLEMVMEVGAPQNEWEQQAVQRLHDVVVKARESSAAREAPVENAVAPRSRI